MKKYFLALAALLALAAVSCQKEDKLVAPLPEGMTDEQYIDETLAQAVSMIDIPALAPVVDFVGDIVLPSLDRDSESIKFKQQMDESFRTWLSGFYTKAASDQDTYFNFSDFCGTITLTETTISYKPFASNVPKDHIDLVIDMERDGKFTLSWKGETFDFSDLVDPAWMAARAYAILHNTTTPVYVSKEDKSVVFSIPRELNLKGAYGGKDIIDASASLSLNGSMSFGGDSVPEFTLTGNISVNTCKHKIEANGLTVRSVGGLPVLDAPVVLTAPSGQIGQFNIHFAEAEGEADTYGIIQVTGNLLQKLAVELNVPNLGAFRKASSAAERNAAFFCDLYYCGEVRGHGHHNASLVYMDTSENDTQPALVYRTKGFVPEKEIAVTDFPKTYAAAVAMVGWIALKLKLT